MLEGWVTIRVEYRNLSNQNRVWGDTMVQEQH